MNASVVAVCGLDSFSHLWEVDSHSVDGKDHTHTFKRVEMKLSGTVLPYHTQYHQNIKYTHTQSNFFYIAKLSSFFNINLLLDYFGIEINC